MPVIVQFQGGFGNVDIILGTIFLIFSSLFLGSIPARAYRVLMGESSLLTFNPMLCWVHRTEAETQGIAVLEAVLPPGHKVSAVVTGTVTFPVLCLCCDGAVTVL